MSMNNKEITNTTTIFFFTNFNTEVSLNWRMITFVEIPEEKQFPSTGRGTSHMSKEVNTGVPKYSIKTQHHLGQGQQRLGQNGPF